MKLLVTLFFLLIICGTHSFGQSAFYDAMTLAKSIEDDGSKAKLVINNPDIYKILIKYVPELLDEATADQIEDAFDKANNPFISKKNASIVFAKGSMATSTLGTGNKIGPLNSGFVANANISNFADGLATFLVERFKEEMNIHFISKFKDFLAAYPEARIIFPESFSVLQNIETFQYASILQVLKESFEKDIQLLAIHLPEIKDLKKADCPNCPASLTGDDKKKCIERKTKCDGRISNLEAFFKTEKGTLLMASLISVREVQQGTSPANILNTLANDKSLDNLPSEMNNSLKLINLFSQSFINNSGQWASHAEINKFLKNEHAIKVYLGLLYQQAGDDLKYKLKDVSGVEIKFREIINKTKTDIKVVRQFISDFSQVSSDLNSHFNTLKIASEENKNLSFYDYHKFLTSLGDMIEASLKTEKLFALVKTDFKFPADVKTAVDEFYRPSLNIAYDIAEKKYSAAIYDIVGLLVDLGISKDDGFIDGFKKYGLFVAQVSKAESSKEVKEAIEAIALPVGSARIKRETKYNIALQAYLGGFFGVETIPELQDIDSTNTRAFSAAVHAPVGIAFSCGNDDHSSWSLFFSVIDIGAVTAYRFKDDQTEVLPSFTLQNILAPGGYVLYGFRNSPISVGVGAQMGPAIRKLSKTTNGIDVELNNTANWRIGATIVVDIPLINLSTKPRVD